MRLIKKDKERIAFFFDHALAMAVTVASIWFASRIGYGEAIRFSQYEEIRSNRNLLRAVEHELTLNETALRTALRDVGSPEYRNLNLLTTSLDRAKESDQFFLLDKDTIRALNGVYTETFMEGIKAIRKHPSASTLHLGWSTYVWSTVERIEEVKPLVRTAIERLEAELTGYGLEDLAYERTMPAPLPEPQPTAHELAVSQLQPSPGWKRSKLLPDYTGSLGKGLFWDHAKTPPCTQGPIVIKWTHFVIPRDKKPKAIHLCFSQRAPMPEGVELDAEVQRRFFSGGDQDGSFVLSHPIEVNNWMVTRQLVDPNMPLGWRWVYILLEDEDGVRYPLDRWEIWKVATKKEASGPKLTTWIDNDPKRPTQVMPRGYGE